MRALEQIHKEKRSGVSAVAIAAKTGLSGRVVQEQLGVLIELEAVRREGKARNSLYFPGRENHAGGL